VLGVGGQVVPVWQAGRPGWFPPEFDWVVGYSTSVTDPLGDARSNLLGTINLLACRRARVQQSHLCGVGRSRLGAPMSLPASKDTPVGPLSPNAAAKLAAELYLCAYAENVANITDLACAGQCVRTTPKPHGDSGMVAIFGGPMIAARPVTMYGYGTAVRDYVYIDDVVDAFMFAGQLPPEVTGTYNIGTGEQTTVSEVYRLAAEAAGVSSPPRYAAVRTGEVHAIALDSKKDGRRGRPPGVIRIGSGRVALRLVTGDARSGVCRADVDAAWCP
jgi:UDP-glucose 4-epimerase